MAYEEDDYSRMWPSLSPIMSAGVDPDEALASGDAPGMIAAKRAGVPYVPKRTMQTQQPQPTSMLAQAATLPQPVETFPKGTLPSGARVDTSPGSAVTTSRQSPAGTALAQGSTAVPSETPATNAPNPPSEQTGAPTVPATVTPNGNAQPSHATFQGAADMQMDAARRAQELQQRLLDQPSADEKLRPISSKLAQLQSPASTQNPDGVPNPKDPQYRPSGIRRIGRGVVAGLEGLARGRNCWCAVRGCRS